MVAAGSALVIVFGLWLIAVGVLAAARPRVALRFLGKAASTNLINYGELSLRLIAGAAFVLSAEVSRFPTVFLVFGWFVVASSIAMMLIPRRWHARYAVWWAGHLSPAAVRFAAPLSWAFGAFVIYAMV